MDKRDAQTAKIVGKVITKKSKQIQSKIEVNNSVSSIGPLKNDFFSTTPTYKTYNKGGQTLIIKKR